MKNLDLRLAGALALLALISISLNGCSDSNSTHPTSDAELASVSVAITNMAQNHGGSGVILRSSNTGSLILTNRHVCGVVKNGGLVKTDNNKLNTVVTYSPSQTHDLCLITVAENLHIGVRLASETPEDYTPAAIVGHPGLLPTTVTRGHFSGSQIITLLTGMRECTDKDLEDPGMAFLCDMLGALPVFESYQAQHVTATIMPGSSGSPIFNRRGNLTGLAFAGMGQLGYAFAVPSEYVRFFLSNELPQLHGIKPSYQSGINLEEASNLHDIGFKLMEACKQARDKNLNVAKLCLDNVILGDDLIK